MYCDENFAKYCAKYLYCATYFTMYCAEYFTMYCAEYFAMNCAESFATGVIRSLVCLFFKVSKLKNRLLKIDTIKDEYLTVHFNRKRILRATRNRTKDLNL